MDERSQSANRKAAIERIRYIVAEKQQEAKAQSKKEAWQAHTTLQRGGAARTYRGKDFRLDK